MKGPSPNGGLLMVPGPSRGCCSTLPMIRALRSRSWRSAVNSGKGIPAGLFSAVTSARANRSEPSMLPPPRRYPSRTIPGHSWTRPARFLSRCASGRHSSTPSSVVRSLSIERRWGESSPRGDRRARFGLRSRHVKSGLGRTLTYCQKNDLPSYSISVNELLFACVGPTHRRPAGALCNHRNAIDPGAVCSYRADLSGRRAQADSPGPSRLPRLPSAR
jgi:hypothetical protein